MKTNLDIAITRALQLRSFQPGWRVNRRMTKLVNAVTNHTSQTISAYAKAHEKPLHILSSATEFELESFWSKRIAAARIPEKALLLFPYTTNYAQLVTQEVSLLAQSGLQLNPKSTVLVIGSGPLPLTGIELIRQTGATIEFLDSSRHALTLSQQFCESIGYAAAHHHGKGETAKLDTPYDVILLAALAGANDREKQSIIHNILPALKPDGRLIARSAQGSRALLYPAITASFDGLTLLSDYHPSDEVINSVLIYRKDSNEK